MTRDLKLGLAVILLFACVLSGLAWVGLWCYDYHAKEKRWGIQSIQINMIKLAIAREQSRLWYRDHKIYEVDAGSDTLFAYASYKDSINVKARRGGYLEYKGIR